MDSDLLATMGIGGFGKQKKKPIAGPPPQQQARHDAARRPTAATSAHVAHVSRPPFSNFVISLPTTSFTLFALAPPRVRISPH